MSVNQKSYLKLRKKKIAILGLGYVGLPLALEFGRKFETLGYDISNERIKELRFKKDINLLSSKKDFLQSKKISFTSTEKNLLDCNIFIITVPTPVKKNKNPDLSYLTKATKTVAKYLKINDFVIYESTVYPGLTEEHCIPILEKLSKLKLNLDFFVGYSPERINPGDGKSIKNINKVVSGSTPKSTTFIYSLYKSIIKAQVFKAKSIKVAEASKIIENAQRDINISFMNELSLIFKKLNINTQDVLDAAKTKWNFLDFKPGLVGGHCISVDPYYLTYKAKKHHYSPKVILSGRDINNNMGYFIAKVLLKKLKKNNLKLSKCTVGIFGITYKENSNDIRDSKVLDIIKVIKKSEIKLRIYDPIANQNEFKKYFPDLKIKKIKEKLDALIIAVPHKEFLKLNYSKLTKLLKNNNFIIIDIKSILSEKIIKDKYDYWSL